jgi:multidrug efflux pump subunit AcrA (membrane-fusion protein)
LAWIDNTASSQDQAINALRVAVDDLRKELMDNKAELAKEKADRKAELAKEKADREFEQVRLDERLQWQAAQLEEQDKDLSLHKMLLAQERTERKREMSTISLLTLKLIPLHLRVLLDRGRQEVLKVVGADSWQDFCDARSIHEITELIMRALANANAQHRPSQDALEFLCCYNNIRREGNYQAHTASQEEMREAVLTKPIDSHERRRLTELYEFIFHSLL